MTKETLFIVCAFMFVACQHKVQTATNEKAETDTVAQPKDTVLIKWEKSEDSASDTFDITDDAPKKFTHLTPKVSKTKQGINIKIMENNTELQSIDYRYDTEFEPNPGSQRDSVVLRDVTSDGNKDLLVYLGSFGNQGVEYFDCYVWNDSGSTFVHTPTFKDIQNPTFSNGCIFSKARESASTYIYERWTYRKGRFTSDARLVQRYSADRTCRYDEYLIKEKRQRKSLTREQITKFWLNIIN